MANQYGHIHVTNDGWTRAAVEALTAIWATGLSASAIARVLHCSKGAAIGKVHRIRLKARPSPLPNLARRAAERRRALVDAVNLSGFGGADVAFVDADVGAAPAEPQPEPAAPAEPAAPVAPDAPVYPGAPPPVQYLARQGGQCRWPLWGNSVQRGQPGYGQFCAAAPALGRSYCQQHRVASAPKVPAGGVA